MTPQDPDPSGDERGGPSSTPSWPTYQPGAPAGSADHEELDHRVGPTRWQETSPPDVVIGRPPTAAPARRGAGPLLVALAAIGMIAGVCVVVVVSLSGGTGEQRGVGEPGPAAVEDARPPEPPQLHTPAGWRSLVRAVREETGSTRAFSVVLYPEYAVLDVPAQPSGARFHSYHYDGELTMSTKGTSPYRVFDLGRIDPAVTVRLLATAGRELVEDPTSTYAIIRRPDDGTAWYSVYASNEYSESGFLQADLTGRETRRYVSTP